MKKSDLVAGKHVVKYRDGKFRFVGNGNGLLDSVGHYMHGLRYYDERLNDIDGDKSKDIVAVYELNEVWKREELTITEDEKAILRNLPEKFKWIARDENGKLCIYRNKPGRLQRVWSGEEDGEDDFEYLNLFNHLFQMIRWEDDEPWKIEDLLRLDVKNL